MRTLLGIWVGGIAFALLLVRLGRRIPRKPTTIEEMMRGRPRGGARYI